MKIVDVCAFYSPHGGGVKTYVRQKLVHAARSGHEIVILAPGDRYEVIEHGPLARVRTLPSPRFPLDQNYWYFDDEPALHRALDDEAPDFVEASSPWRSPLMVARWNRDVPRSLVMHADPLSAYAYRWLQPVFSRSAIDRRLSRFWDHLRLLGRSFDLVVCANSDLSARLQANGVAGVITCPMGVEDGIFAASRRDESLRTGLLVQCGLPPDAHLLVGAGRLAPEKRWPMVVDAATMASQHLPIGLVLFGAGREKRAILRSIGGNPHIRLFEPETDRQHFARILASADALLHGCEAETFCMVAAEARASGVPVIVPDQGGAADHARDGGGHAYQAANPISAARAIADVLARGSASANLPPVRTMSDHFQSLFEAYRQQMQGRRHAA